MGTRTKTRKKLAASQAFERALTAKPVGKCILRLYVAGATERSRQAVLRAREFCEADLAGNFLLEVIDVYQQPTLARDGQIVVTPTLVREFPRPVRRLIGDLSNPAGLLVGLNRETQAKSVR